MKNRKFFIGFVILIGLIAAFYFLNNFIYKEKQGNDINYEPYRATLSGEYVCLPHKDTSGPQTLECAFGLKTTSGEYYAVDFSLMSQEHAPVETGKRITANGVVTPVERLSSDHWKIYPIKAIFSVTDSLLVQ